jgi:nitrogen fixation protein FixH
MTAQATTHDPRRSRWIPYAFVGFFLVVMAPNAVMIWFAFTSWTGLTAEHSYQQGLAYNDTLAAARAQAALGWQVEIAFAEPAAGRLGMELALADRYGNPLENAVVSAALVRPTQEGYDTTVALERRLANHYGAEVVLPLAGQWDARFTVEVGDAVWRGTRRVFLRR